MAEAAFRAGFGECDITPPIGVALCGGLRPRASVSVGTPLSVRALALDDGQRAAAIVAVDLCVLAHEIVDAATAAIAERTGIPPEHVLVAASHTHAGPYTSGVFSPEGCLDSHYLALLPRYIADAATLAHERLEPASVGVASGRHEESSHYRRVLLKSGYVRNTWLRPDPDEVVGPAGEIDPEVGFVMVKNAQEEPIASVFNYTLHANCHEPPNNRIDGSYPVRVDQHLRDAIASPTLYTAGACGNLNPTAGANQVGEALAKELLRLADGLQTTPDVRLWAKKVEVTLPLRDFSKLRIDAIRRDWPDGEEVFREEWRRLHEAGDTEVKTWLQVLAINDVAFVANPGELCVELGREIKRQSPFAYTYVVELANDYVGYIPHRAAYDEGGYELLDARSAKVAAEAGEIVVAESVRLLEEAREAMAG